ncbi:hypothetical protein [Lacinutrix himadriensis]|uniref:hypothetical protein n=1 Tax=Lacinutrix himadriensis TaxID=641549 RepID=UPI0006E430BF|nr:hypothetical protein [Lacinutrix himadriensis]
MNTNIYYQVETKYWRREVPNIHDALSDRVPTQSDIAETSTLYKNDSPLVARSAAFNHFNSIIDVLYEGLGTEQTSDAQARIDLQCYLDSGNGIEYLSKFPDKKFKMLSRDDIHNRIEIYVVIEGVKTAIHGLRCLEYTDRLDEGIIENLEGLILEYKYYKNNQFAIDKEGINITLETSDGKITSILKTPVDWKQLQNYL